MKRKQDALAIGALIVLVALFYGDYLAGKSFIWEDALYEIYPGVNYFCASVAHGRFPLWIAGVRDGMPFYSDIQLGVFYPPTWLLIPFAGSGALPAVVYQWFIVLHVLLGGALMYGFLRTHELRPVSCLTGAVTFCFAGFMSLHVIHPNMIQVCAWLPLQLWLVRRGRFVWLIPATLMSFLAGHPQTTVYTSYLVIAYWLLCDRQWRTVPKIAGVYLAVLALGAVALLPAWENFRHSGMPGRNVEAAGELSMPFRHLLTFAFPNFFGSVTESGTRVPFWGGEGPTTGKPGFQTLEHQYWEWGAYAGQVALVALVVLLASWKGVKRRRDVVFFAGAWLMAAWFMLGRHGGLFQLAYHVLPGISLFRGPSKMACVADFAAAGLVAFAVDEVAAVNRLKLRWPVVVLGVAYAIAVVSASGDSQIQVLIGCGLLAATFLAFRYAPVTLPVLVAVDLALAHGAFHKSAKSPTTYYADKFNLRPGLRQLREQIGDFRVGQFVDGKLSMEVVFPRNTPYLHADLEFPEGYTTFSLRGYGALQSLTNEEAKADLQNVRVALSKEANSDVAGISARESGLPRAKFYSRVRSYESEEHIFRDLETGALDYRNEIGVIGPASSTTGEGTVHVERPAPETYRLRYRVNSPGIIFVSESYYPGWRVVNADREIVKTFGAFLGVVIPEAGEGELVLRFEPRVLRVGLLVSGFALAGWVIWASRRALP